MDKNSSNSEPWWGKKEKLRLGWGTAGSRENGQFDRGLDDPSNSGKSRGQRPPVDAVKLQTAKWEGKPLYQ